MRKFSPQITSSLRLLRSRMKRVYRRQLTHLTRLIPKALLRIDNAHDLLSKIDSSAFLAVWFVHPVNGQLNRQKTITDIALKFFPQIVIETGTYVGSTTPYLASLASEKAITIEIHDKFLTQAKVHFVHLGAFGKRIEVLKGDSAEELERILGMTAKDKKLLFYLDAHWGSVLPLKRELKAITKWNGNFVIVVDDFKISDDESYGFDHYGDEFVGVGCIPSTFQGELWFPDHSSELETGGRKGTAYLFSSNALRALNPREISGIRPFKVFI